MVKILNTISSALSSIALLPSKDVVAVFDQNFNQVFSQAIPMKAVIKPVAKTMEHPVETGVTITDHIIFLPIEIELNMMLTGIGGVVGFLTGSTNYQSVYAQINSLFKAGTLLTVQTKTATYANMIIESIPHDEDPDRWDTVPLALKLRQVQFVQAQFATLPPSSVRNPANASTQQLGQVQPQAATAEQQAFGANAYSRNLTGISVTP